MCRLTAKTFLVCIESHCEVPTLTLRLHARLCALLQHSEEDLKQGQQHLGLSDPGLSPVSRGLGLLESLLNLVCSPALLALAFCFAPLLFACMPAMWVKAYTPARQPGHSLCCHCTTARDW